MKVVTSTIGLNSCKEFEVIDITSQVKGEVRKSKVSNGMVVVSSLHTTTAVIVNEKEPGIFEDLQKSFEKLSPKNGVYEHNNLLRRNMPPDEPKNGHSHVLASIIGGSQTLPVCNGKIVLGTWQSIFLVELDSARKRTVSVTIFGE